MLKKMLVVLGFIFCFTMLVMAFFTYQQSSITESDLKFSEGIISTVPEISRDEYDFRNTAMRFYLENQEIPVSIPGKLLNNADQEIVNLKIGDKVSFYEKNHNVLGTMDKTRRIAFGLSSDKIAFYTQQDALEFFQGFRFKIITYSFIALSCIVFVLLMNWIRIAT